MQDEGTVELAVSDHSQIGLLEGYLGLVAPDAVVTRTPGKTDQGELGTLDVLTIVADSGVLIAVVNSLPAFLQSRKPGVSITVKSKKGTLTVTAKDSSEAAPVLDRFLDD